MVDIIIIIISPPRFEGNKAEAGQYQSWTALSRLHASL